MQEVQPLHQKADVQQLPAALHLVGDLLSGELALTGQLCRLQHQLANAGGEAAGVHGVDVPHLLSGDAGILVAGGHIAGDVEMHHGVALLQLAAEELGVVVHRHRRCAAHSAAGIDVGVNFVGGDVLAVYQRLAVPDDVQGGDADVVFFNKLRGQITGAVSGYSNIHD